MTGRSAALRPSALIGAILATVAVACVTAPANPKDPDTLVIMSIGYERALGPCWDISAQLLLSLPLAEDADGEVSRGTSPTTSAALPGSTDCG